MTWRSLPRSSGPASRERAITRSRAVERLLHGAIHVVPVVRLAGREEDADLVKVVLQVFSALSSPRLIGDQHVLSETPSTRSIPSRTAAASASCGITSGRTKLVTSR